MAPLTNEARSEARKAATSATSDGCPARPSVAFSARSGRCLRPDAPMISVRIPADLGSGVLLGTTDIAGDDAGSLSDEHLDRRLRHARTGPGDHRHLALQQPH